MKKTELLDKIELLESALLDIRDILNDVLPEEEPEEEEFEELD